jgi:hypothetical protein
MDFQRELHHTPKFTPNDAGFCAEQKERCSRLRSEAEQ